MRSELSRRRLLTALPGGIGLAGCQSAAALAGREEVASSYTAAGQGAGTRTVQARLRDLMVSVKDFGAIGDGVADDTAAIEAALAAASLVLLPPGTYRITSTIVLPSGGGLVGFSPRLSSIRADHIRGAAVRFTPAGYSGGPRYTQRLVDLNVTGVCTTAVACTYTMNSVIRDVAVDATCTDAFEFQMCWGCSFENLNTDSAAIDQDSGASFRLLDNYQGNYGSNWYCGGTSRPFYGVLMTGGTTHGNTLDNLVLQCCRYGLYVQLMDNMGGLTVNGLYTENTVTPVRLGDDPANGWLVRGVMLNGGSLGGPYPDHPYYASRTACVELSYAFGVTIQGVSFEGVWGTPVVLDAIHYDSCNRVFVAGCYVPQEELGADITPYVKRMSGGGHHGSGITIFQQGDNGETQLIMKADGTAHRHFKMSLTAAGAWLATEWTPALA